MASFFAQQVQKLAKAGEISGGHDQKHLYFQL